MIIRESGRSTDFISPSFGHGCLYNCSYCYMKRHKPEGLSVANNPHEILQAIENHHNELGLKEPNQTHDLFWTYDISCNEDFALHLKYHDWKNIFSYFVGDFSPFASFATKYVNEDLLDFNPRDNSALSKIRVRMSLIPEEFREILEPNTSSIAERLLFIDKLIGAGYDVHVNFSPVIVVPGALKLYENLFKDLNVAVSSDNKSRVKAEVIFLTHNDKKHQYNLDNNISGEDLLWNPKIQRKKQSSYGGVNLRYEPKLKNQLVKEFKELHSNIIPWNTIRYIF